MSGRHDPWTGKPIDRLRSRLPKPNGSICDDCGGECIDRCMMCGAPQCCPTCCFQAHEEYRLAQGIAARSDETRSGSAVGKSPTPQGDAPTLSAASPEATPTTDGTETLPSEQGEAS